MAARQPDVTVQSVLGKISRHHLECPICSDRFTEPKVLDCLHCFCLHCLKEVRQNQNPQDPKLVCPLCRRKTILRGDVSDLPSDFKLRAFVDEVNFYENLLGGQKLEIKCQACDEENQAVSRCMDCEHFICEPCQAVHRRFPSLKSHQIYTLAHILSEVVTYKSKFREYTPKCGKHSNHNLNIYCNTCEKLVCTTSAIVDRERHSCVNLLEAGDKCKQDVHRMSEKDERNKAKLKTNISEVDAKYRKLNATNAETTKKISSKADKEVAKIEEEISREEKQKLKQEADTILKFETPSSDTTAKALQRTARWELKRQMKTFGPTKKTFKSVEAIAAFSNNEIVTLDGGNTKLITFLTIDNLLSDVISQELQLAGLSKPTHVSVRGDEIVVLDGLKVKIFNRGYQPCLHQFLPGRKTGSTPTCLAVDGGDVIAVGYEKQEEISLHKRDGSLIRRIPAPKIGLNLTIHKQLFIYIQCGDNDNELLSSVDKYGDMVFSVDIPTNSQGKCYASGLCCDKDGNIYVAVSGWPLQNKIHHFSHNGHYIGCVLSECGYPRDITCTPAGELAVAAFDHVAVYHHV